MCGADFELALRTPELFKSQHTSSTMPVTSLFAPPIGLNALDGLGQTQSSTPRPDPPHCRPIGPTGVDFGPLPPDEGLHGAALNPASGRYYAADVCPPWLFQRFTQHGKSKPLHRLTRPKPLHRLTRLEHRRPLLQLYDAKAVEALLSTGTLSLKCDRKSLCNREEGS